MLLLYNIIVKSGLLAIDKGHSGLCTSRDFRIVTP